MKYGLSIAELNQIQQVFANSDKVKRVILFGSRALGTYRPGSDVDLAIQGSFITLNDVLSLSIQLEELDFLIRFDVLNYSSIADSGVLDHINRIGITIYDRSTYPTIVN